MNELHIYWLMVASAVALVVGTSWLVVAKGLLPCWRRFRQYSTDCGTCGYLPPTPTPRQFRRTKRLVRFMRWLQVGPVKFVNWHNALIPGPRLIAPNHGMAADPVVIGDGFDEQLRYMAAKGVFDFAGGFGSLVAGPGGAFCADLTPGKGAPAKDAAVKALVDGESLCLFPEGWAYVTGKMGKLKKGAVRIVKEAAKKLGRPVHLVPTYMRYGTYAGEWILKLPMPVQFGLILLLFPIYRRGCTVVFGTPISSDDLPENDTEGTEMLRLAIVALDPGPR